MKSRPRTAIVKANVARPLTSKVDKLAPAKVKKAAGTKAQKKVLPIVKEAKDTRLAKYGQYLNKNKLISMLLETEEIKELNIFEKDSVICKDTKPYLSPSLFLADAFKRYEENKEDKMHLYDIQLYSSLIYKKVKEDFKMLKLIGPLRECATGKVMSYLEYEFVMITLRYLNKSFIIYTEEQDSFCFQMRHKKAQMKVNITKVYEGQFKMPLLRHPFYKFCTKLNLIYKIYDEVDELNAAEYEQNFLKDVLSDIKHFPNLINLKIKVSHSLRLKYDIKNLSNIYSILLNSENFEILESLCIEDNRLYIDWSLMQFINPKHFPNLKSLELPINCIFDFDHEAEQQDGVFEDLHIKYNALYDFEETFNLRVNSRYFNKLK